MEQTVARTVTTTVHNVPSQASSMTVFQSSPVRKTIPNGSTTSPNSEKPKEIKSDSAASTQNQPTTSDAPATPVRTGNKTKSPKSSPAKSQSKSKSKQQPDPNSEPLDCRVEVSGYPSFAKPQDLQKVLSPYGAARVEHNGRKFAVVAFDSAEAAAAALRDSRQLCLYGHFLTVQPFTGCVDDQKKQVYRSKHTVVTVPPESIPLEGTFGEQLAALLAAVRLTQEQVTALAALYGDLERVMQPMWPGCQAMPFGSITTGLGVKSSDADCFMNIPPQYRYGCYNFVNKAKRILQQYPELFTEVFAIPRANTPIVKLFHLPTETHCDLTFKTPLGALNSKLVAFLLHADPRFLPLAVVVKYWASVHGISGSGKLTNYALTLMLIFYLQARGSLPAVAWLQRGAEPLIVDGWNAGFLEKYDRLPRMADDVSLQDLLGGFFKFYDAFDFQHQVACPYLGCTIEKAQFASSTLPDEFGRYKRNVADNLVAPLRTRVPVCVQDPFEQCHNVASSVTARMAEDLRVYIRFAAERYEKDKATGCEGFLRTILLEKPKLIRVRSNPEYRVTLHPKQLDTIVHDDWKGAFRRTIFTIFERILKLKLTPTGEKETNHNGRDKERYVTSMNKPLWKRKQFLRLYEAVQMGFVERQERVTEEILVVERSDWVIEFQVILSFCTKIRSAWIAIRLTNGDMDPFFPFGKFFLAMMQSYVMSVLHACGDTSAKDNLTKLESPNSASSNVTNNDNDSDGVANAAGRAGGTGPEGDPKDSRTITKEPNPDAPEKAAPKAPEEEKSTPVKEAGRPSTAAC